MGLAALPLWWLAFPTGDRLAVDSDGIRQRQGACQIPSGYGDVCAFGQHRSNGSHESAGSRQQDAAKSGTRHAGDAGQRCATDFNWG